jgi:hypothetical protein
MIANSVVAVALRPIAAGRFGGVRLGGGGARGGGGGFFGGSSNREAGKRGFYCTGTITILYICKKGSTKYRASHFAFAKCKN